MSTNVPTISVTPHLHHSSSSSDSDSDTSNSHDNDMNYSRKWGESTDVEDFDSQADSVKAPTKSSSKNHLAAPEEGTSHELTDVEDYDASDSDMEGDGCDKEPSFPELKLSLEEFLNNDVQALQSVDNEAIERVERRSGNFLHAQNLTQGNDYLTDCEDYHTDSEIENECEKSVCFDLDEALVEPGRVNIADATGTPNVSYVSDEHDDVSIASNISDLALDMAGARAPLKQVLSEDEVLEISGDEEVCQIAFSDSDSRDDDDSHSDDGNVSIPPLDVTFLPPLASVTRPAMKPACSSTSNCKFLAVEERKEEVLTDIERLDDDDDDSYDDDEKPIPQAVILAPGDLGDCHTDCEDISCDENSYADLLAPEAKGHTVDVKVLPQPQREVVLLQEDKFGDTITSVMPMDEEYQFGMGTYVREECATDSEEYSCADEDDPNEVSSGEPSMPSPSGLIESDITIANEQLKAHISKRLEIQSNTESVTDVEEFYMDGTNVRRKKLKTRTMSKNKSKFLDVPKAGDEAKTDTEDMDLSESELPQGLKCTPKANPSINLPPVQIDKATDIEDLTADDISSASEQELPQIDRMTTNLKDYDTSSSNVVIASEACCSSENVRPNKKSSVASKTHHNNGHHQQQHTDVEDVQLPSDAEDYIPSEPPSTDLPNELHELLNAGCTTTVHEKCQSSFNVDAEKIHIKGMLREAHTDVEYVESDESAARGSK